MKINRNISRLLKKLKNGKEYKDEKANQMKRRKNKER